MNNNKLDEAALAAGCKGVFSKPSYITIGTKERPEEYTKKGYNRSVFGGKQVRGRAGGQGRRRAAGRTRMAVPGLLTPPPHAPPPQLSTVPAKEGKTIDVYFEKKHNWINDVGGRACARGAF